LPAEIGAAGGITFLSGCVLLLFNPGRLKRHFLLFLILFSGIPGFAQRHGDTLKNGKYYLDRASSLREAESFSEALSLLYIALDKAEAEKDSATLFETHFQLGEILARFGNSSKAKEYLDVALSIAKARNDHLMLSAANNGLGIVSLNEGEHEKALGYFTASLAIAQKNGSKGGERLAYNNIGLVYSGWEQYGNAQDFYERSYRISQEANDTSGIITARINISDCALQLKRPDEAIRGLEEALALAKLSGNLDLQATIYGGLTLAYQQKKDFEKAFGFFTRHVALNDSVYSIQSDQKIQELEEKYKSERRQREIAELKARQQENEAQLSESREALVRRTTWLVSISVTLAVIMLFAYLLYRQYKSKARINQLLSERNREISEQKSLLETNLTYTQRLQEALKQDLNHYQQVVLRKQMNPHFIFNSLNSLQQFILQNDKLSASLYLSDFSGLMRRVLANSQKDLVSLKEEMATLQLYIGLEQRRFEQKFEFNLELQDDLSLSLFMIPPFILQPYVENAIWHGLLHKTDSGVLTIRIRKTDNFIVCEIIDNGIGRAAAQAIKSHDPAAHESLGTKITEKRLELIGSLNGTQISAKFEDLSDANGDAAGTKVIVTVPVISAFTNLKTTNA
jgi:tetratricopeptide (TPR) repeat protein